MEQCIDFSINNIPQRSVNSTYYLICFHRRAQRMHLPPILLSTMVLHMYIEFLVLKLGLDQFTTRPLVNCCLINIKSILRLRLLIFVEPPIFKPHRAIVLENFQCLNDAKSHSWIKTFISVLSSFLRGQGMQHPIQLTRIGEHNVCVYPCCFSQLLSDTYRLSSYHLIWPATSWQFIF